MTQLKPLDNEHPPWWHLEKFTDFARCKADAGEPSSHVRCVVAMGEHASWGQRVWMIGCYAAPYSIPSGEVIWRTWSYERILSEGLSAFAAWILQTWGHLHIRNERRCVRAPQNFVACLLGYFAWIATLDAMVERGAVTYRALWNSVSSVPYIGRYIAIRILEALRLAELIPIGVALDDVRAVNGPSVARCLALLYPDHSDAILREDADTINGLGAELVDVLKHHAPTQATFYAVNALLCQYRKSYEDRNEYTENTLDAEYAHLMKIIAFWHATSGHVSTMLATRERLFPSVHLAEKSLGAWTGVRKDVATTLRDYGYVWSDALYDYGATASLSQPVCRDSAPTLTWPQR